MNMWEKLLESKKMILGLSPMDGVTDAAMRFMVAKYGSRQFSNSQIKGVDIIFTEFVSVDALHFATGERRERLLKTFLRAQDVAVPLQDPPYEIAQVFGHTIDYFREAAELVESLGFDGIDINMGCPAHKVEEQGSGAGLIRTPELAKEIILAVKSATKLPVSVKTRIGVECDVAESWMEHLMEARPANISLHGRTLRQLYQGSADWEAIGRAARVVHEYGGIVLGNGDVESLDDAQAKAKKYKVDGVLIGRAAEGNPGIFIQSQITNSQILQSEPSREQRLAWMVEHTAKFEELFVQCHGDTVSRSKAFMPMRKHLAWYCKGFPGAVEMRAKLMMTNSLSDVERVVQLSRDE